MFKDIVVGVTPSGVDECAADTAIEFAERFESKLYLVHVCGLGQGWGQMRHLEASGETDRIKSKIEEFYSEKLAKVKDYSVVVVPGVPHNELLRVARSKNADLVVMGPHTKEYAEMRSKMWGMAGSTLERVSQKARCPVMIVSKEGHRSQHEFKNIVVATDFSYQAECAVNYGGQMARQYKSALTIFNVLEERDLSQSEIEKRANESKERMQAEFGSRLHGIEGVTFEAWEGKPAMEILKLARMREADLILMAHHSKEKDPEKALLGSTVVQVALNAVCPTMSVNRHFDLRCGMMYDQTGDVVDRSKEEAPA